MARTAPSRFRARPSRVRRDAERTACGLDPDLRPGEALRFIVSAGTRPRGRSARVGSPATARSVPPPGRRGPAPGGSTGRSARGARPEVAGRAGAGRPWSAPRSVASSRRSLSARTRSLRSRLLALRRAVVTEAAGLSGTLPVGQRCAATANASAAASSARSKSPRTPISEANTRPWTVRGILLDPASFDQSPRGSDLDHAAEPQGRDARGDLGRRVQVIGFGEVETDGPFADTKEYFAGFYLAEADDLDAAAEIAARIPALRFGGVVEIRPLLSGDSDRREP